MFARPTLRMEEAEVKNAPKRELIALVLFLPFLYSGTLPGAQGQKSRETAIPVTLSVCEALAHAAKYDGKIVRIRDRVVGSDEFSAFRSEDCPHILITDGKIWPSQIVWTMTDNVDQILHPVDFRFDWESQKNLQKKWQELSKRVPDRCITVMYTGMFEVWSKSKARKPSRDGWVEFSGFGHLNGWGAQLVLKSADEVAPIPNCSATK
jgi:hypothetical protein